jgi:hypothetical protein
MQAPEEDFLALMPVAQCFLMVIAFPRADWLWRTARLDADADETERQRLMRYYRACVQKHLYVHGPERTFLSKNASFSGMAEALLETFPDARVLACTRAPRKTVPSQLSAIEPGLNAAGFRPLPAWLRDRFIGLLRDYYRHLAELARQRPDRVVIVDNADLHDRLEATVRAAYDRLGLDISPSFGASLAAAAEASREFRSAHRYSLAQYDLTPERIDAWFADVDAGDPAVKPVVEDRARG